MPGSGPPARSPARPERAGATPLIPGRLPLLTALDGVIAGDLAHFKGGLVGPDDTRARVRADHLLNDAMLAGILSQRWGATEPPDRRAAVSLWALSYFERVLPPLLIANILLDRTPRFGADQVSFVLAANHFVAALHVTADRPVAIGMRFDTLITAHLAPLIDHLASRGGVTRRVLWSNAGHIFEAFLTMIAKAAAERPGLAEAWRLLDAPDLPSGGGNPLFQPVRYAAGRRVRRVCCLRFLVREWRICAICPLQADSPARTRSAGLGAVDRQTS